MKHDGDRRARLAAERRALPVWSARAKLVEEVRAHPVVVVVGETGSGKTTQIPQLLLQAGLARGGLVGVTQPRRVAALTVARRVADEMGVPLGREVGYAIRFDDCTSAATRIQYMTDGLLLREALTDPLLSRYQVVVVDEAHERSVHTDVLLALLKGVALRRGGGFRLLVMSATLDSAKFADYFGGARVAYIQGRQHPVEVLYTSQPEDSYLDAALCATLQVHVDEPPGDILVFLTGQEEIEAAERSLAESAAAPGAEGPGGLALAAVPIYAALPPDLQLKAFEPAPPGVRKAILATNIAETSITLPGVRYVIDTGFVKARGHHAGLGADSLQVVPVSQAQARQRSGRAGREGPGRAFRLYTEDAFGALAPTTPPEIQRTNLGSVVLQLKALGISDVVGFDFLDAPPRAAVVRSLELLLALGALDARGELTDPLGRAMARLPVEPLFGKVLLAACDMGCGVDACTVVGMVSTDAVWFTPRGKREEAAAARRAFAAREGDHATLLAVARAFAEVPRKAAAAWASDRFLNIRALRKAQDISSQLQSELRALGRPLASCGADMRPLQRALTAGLFPQAARLQPDGSYRVAATGQTVALHPSSVLTQRKPPWLVFNEVVATTKAYARGAAAVEAAWLPELAPAFFARRGEAGGAGGGGGPGRRV